MAAIFTPEIFVIVSYLALCWLYFATFIDSHDQAAHQSEKKPVAGIIRFRFVVVTLVLL